MHAEPPLMAPSLPESEQTQPEKAGSGSDQKDEAALVCRTVVTAFSWFSAAASFLS